MNLESLAELLKGCPAKSVTVQHDKASGRFVIAVEGDGDIEITRSSDLIQGLQVASEALTKEA